MAEKCFMAMGILQQQLWVRLLRRLLHIIIRTYAGVIKSKEVAK